MTFTASASPRLALAFGLLAASGLGSGYAISAAHAQSTSAPAASAPAAASPAAASTTTPAEVPAPASTSGAPSTTAATDQGHHHGGQALNKYLTTLHEDLKITPSEDSQWTAFADAMRDNAAALGQAYRTRREQLPTMDATQDLNSFIQVEQLRLDGLKKSADAFSALYAVMPPDQKKVADGVFLSDLPGAPHHGGHAKAKPAQ
jgi:hypothetical protein